MTQNAVIVDETGAAFYTSMSSGVFQRVPEKPL